MGLQSHSSPQRSYFGCCEFRSPGFPFQLWHIGPSPPWPTSGFTAVRRTALVPVARFISEENFSIFGQERDAVVRVSFAHYEKPIYRLAVLTTCRTISAVDLIDC